MQERRADVTVYTRKQNHGASGVQGFSDETKLFSEKTNVISPMKCFKNWNDYNYILYQNKYNL